MNMCWGGGGELQSAPSGISFWVGSQGELGGVEKVAGPLSVGSVWEQDHGPSGIGTGTPGWSLCPALRAAPAWRTGGTLDGG